MVLNKLEDYKGKEFEVVDKNRESGGFKFESGFLVKKISIILGFWKVSSVYRVIGTIGVVEKRL